MRHALLALLAACASACGGSSAPTGPDASGPEHGLAMNDISILLPLPATTSSPVLASLAGSGSDTPLVTPIIFDSLVLTGNQIAPKGNVTFTFADMQVVAVRFDLCDRSIVGPCPTDADGRMRLVAEPVKLVDGKVSTLDVATHAFFIIPNADLADVVHQLRAIAAVQDAPADSPLGISTAAIANNPAYLGLLQALVFKYARQDNLARLTVIGQEENSGAFAWVFQGFDHTPGGDLYAYTSMAIPQVNSTVQTVLTAGGDTSYITNPMADLPTGLSDAFTGGQFDAEGSAQELTALAALEEVQNPTLHDAVDQQCAACHVATNLTALRAAHLGVDPTTIATTYSSSHNLAIPSDQILTSDNRVIRAFGWIGTFPAISQRVANDTAHTLDEIDARFPAD